MASFSRRSQSATPFTNGSNGHSAGSLRGMPNTSSNDPLQPLRAMADRVGKEVEKFAERVDHWHTHGNESETAKYHTTVKMVGKFRDLAESSVRELKKQNSAENTGELNKSVRRRIQNMATEPSSSSEDLFGRSVPTIVPSIEQSAPPQSPSVQELRHWQEELATWELVRIIIDHYHSEPGSDAAAEKASRLAKVGEVNRYSSKTDVWTRFILEDDAAREKKAILQWLQQTAQNTESDIESIIEQCGAVSGKDPNTWTSGWLDTKAKIKQAKRMQGSDQPLKLDTTLRSSEAAQPLITRLDPDALSRQKRNLEESDDYYENCLWMICYEMLRRGEPWGKISEWCKERNEAWRGVSIGAAYESHTDGGPNVAGNDLGYLFRRMCFYAARGARMPYEGAVYALLSGDSKQVQAVCRSWDDHLYAYYNALLLSRFDGYLRRNPTSNPWVSESVAQKFIFQDAVANFDDWPTTNKQVVELLKREKATSDQAKSPLKLIQGALISGTVDKLMQKVGIAVADMLQQDERLVNLILDPDSDTQNPTSKKAPGQRAITSEEYYQSLVKDPHALRILVHVFITLNGMGVLDEGALPKVFALADVVFAYIEFLRVTKRLQLIPLYASQLGSPLAAHCLARVLPDIKNTDEQKRFIHLMDQYRLDEIETLNENFSLMLRDTGFVSGDQLRVPNPIARFVILKKANEQDSYLWPGQRITRDIPGLDISAKEQALIESLLWFNHLEKEDEYTFAHLYKALITFLLKGRMGAAEKLVQEMSIENLSLVKTAALCGYAFDFTQAGAEEQDPDQVSSSLRKSLRSSGRDSLQPSEIPSAQEHTRHVQRLRDLSQMYYDLSHIVRLITLFREWRVEEEKLITMRNSSQHVSTTAIKDLSKAIEATFTLLLEPSYDPTSSSQLWALYKAYFPELVISYVSVLQAASFFIHRDSATKAMDLATMVADEDRAWLQKAFLETGRMSELVDTLANVSKAMLKLGEHGDGKAKLGKKRGSKGETLRIWDINVRN